MQWHKLENAKIRSPWPMWGHTCNAVRGGNLVYVFGGFGHLQCRSNAVCVFDTESCVWYEPMMAGKPPTPRDSHSCTAFGDYLFVFGGTDGRNQLNDLHILDTFTNRWILPKASGNGPEPREGHSAAIIDKRLYIFGGHGKSGNSEIYYDDLYVLDTENFVWERVTASGTPPSKRDSQTCSTWKNKIIIIGGEDLSNACQSDVHELDVDTLVWRKLNTMGQLFPPRGGHTTVGIDKNLFVFGGFSDGQDVYDDVFMLDLENATWTEIITRGKGPSGRFAMAGDSLGPEMEGDLLFFGGCDRNLEPLNDMYCFQTGLSRETVGEERQVENLSLRKQLKLKCQAQFALGAEHEQDNTIYQSPTISSYLRPVIQNLGTDSQTQAGKGTITTNVTENFGSDLALDTVIGGKSSSGAVISTKPIPPTTATGNTIKPILKHKRSKSVVINENLNTSVEVPASESKSPTMLSMPQKVSGLSEPPTAPDADDPDDDFSLF